MKKIISLILVCCLTISLSGIVSAYGDGATHETLTISTAPAIDEGGVEGVDYDVSVLNIDDLPKTKSFSPEDIAQMEGDSVARMNESGVGIGTMRGQVTITGYPYGSITNTLTSSNPYDLLPFTLSKSTLFFSRLTSTNTNYRAILCVVDAQGYVYPTSFEYAPGNANRIEIPPNSADTPMYCWLMQSLGSTGQSYTFYFNQSITSSETFLWASNDLSIVFSRNNNTLRCNGVNTKTLYDNNFYFSDGFNIPQSMTVDGNTYGGYRKLDNKLEDVKLRKNSDDTIMVYGSRPYQYVSPTASVAIAWLIPVDAGSWLTNWYHDYMPGPSGWSSYYAKDWLGNGTPIQLTNEHIVSGGAGYMVINALTGEFVDYYGNGNAQYSYGYRSWPTVTALSGAF